MLGLCEMDGTSEGNKLGLSDGLSVGKTDGIELGNSEVTIVGRSLGTMEGFDEGCELVVGCAVNALGVGNEDGLFESLGAKVMADVGVEEMELLGEEDGASDFV